MLSSRHNEARKTRKKTAQQHERKFPMCSLSRGLVFGLLLLLGVVVGRVSSSEEDGCAHVVDGTASRQSSGAAWTFSATVSSPYETGWDKYANEWKIETTDGTLLGTRVLGHPHVTEQPFTRSLSGVEIPDGVSAVVFSAQDSVSGYCGSTFLLVIRETIAPTANMTTTNNTTNTTNTTNSTTIPPIEEPILPSSSNTSGTFASDQSVSNSTELDVLSIAERQGSPVLAIDDDSSTPGARVRCTSSSILSLLTALVLGFGGGLVYIY